MSIYDVQGYRLSPDVGFRHINTIILLAYTVYIIADDTLVQSQLGLNI